MLRNEVELVTQERERLVGRAVVDDDHLVLGVVEVEERTNRLANQSRLVIGRNDNADGNGEAGERERAEVLGAGLAHA